MKIDFKRIESFIPNRIPESIHEFNPELRLFKDDILECWYAPLGRINKKAKIALYGITPGWTQMKMAYQISINNKTKIQNFNSMSKIAFAGSMCANLISMLDELGLPDYLHENSFSDLFGTDKLAYSSILKYPVFIKGKNYNGHNPKLISHPFLKSVLESILIPELNELGNCLIIPLGKTANEGISFLHEKAKLKENQLLAGFPHPSGANSHRKKQFEQNKNMLITQIDKWFNSKQNSI